MTRDQALVDQIKKDFREAAIEDSERAMLAYAEKVTLEHCTCNESDVEHLRSLGFSNVEILDIVQVTAYYNFVNRMACGLGVELEPYWGVE